LNIFGFSRKFRAARRLREIVNVFIRHGFGNLVDQMHLGRYVSLTKRVKSYVHMPSLLKGPKVSERLRLAFEELGPSFIKLAQVLSTRPDLIPSRYTQEFERLQDRVPPFPYEESRAIIEEEISESFESVFRQFERIPIAAASIAQVHRAVLMDGTKVIVKVQRPDIRENLESDMDILYYMSRLLETYVPDSRYLNPTGIVSEFEKTVMKELDFIVEGRNCQRLWQNFKGYDGVRIPKPFQKLMTGRVLVLERIDGVRIDDLDDIRKMGLEPGDVARRALDAYFKMVLVDGIFHGDPHPGNLIVMKDGSIGFMDFGITGQINEETKTLLSNVFLAIMQRDFDNLVDVLIMLGLVPESTDIDEYRRLLKSDLKDLIEPIYGMSMSEIDFARYLDETLDIIVKHKTMVPSDLLLLDKVIMMLEGIVLKLDPDIDIIEAMKPYLSHVTFEKMSPGKAVDEAFKGIKETGMFMKYFPRQIKKILWKVIRDEVVVKLSLKGLDTLIKDIDRSSNRLSVAMIISAVLISSAIMHATEVGPTVYGMSLLGFMVFGFAAVLGIALIISIFRSGRM
jgi:ubiquinone biosynthesis protein